MTDALLRLQHMVVSSVPIPMVMIAATWSEGPEANRIYRAGSDIAGLTMPTTSARDPITRPDRTDISR